MGNTPTVEVETEVDSPSTPGRKSAVSGSLEEYCSYDDFFDALLPILKEPLFPLELYVLKSLDITDETDEGFTIKIYHDGKKLQQYGLGVLVEDGKDFLRMWNRVRFSKEKREVITEELKEDGSTQAICYTMFLRDPFRVEFWVDLPTGERKCDEKMAEVLKTAYIIPALKTLMKRKVSVLHCVDSPGGHGKSALSGSLDEFVEYNACFDMAIEVLQDSVEKQPEGSVVEISDNEFEMTMKAPAMGEEGRDASMKQHIRHDRKTGQIINVASVGGQLLYTSWIIIHRDPLVVEHWTENDGKRMAGRQETGALQALVDSICSKSDGEGGWFF